MRAAMVVPMVAVGRVIGVISFVSRGVRARLHAGRPRARRGARPPRRDRGRERAALRGALAHRRHAPARPAARRAARDRGPAARLAVPPGGRGEPRRRRLLRRLPDALGLDAAGRRRDRARRGGGGADRPGAPHAAHRGHAARRPGRGARAAQPGAGAAHGADAVHRRARARRRGREDRRRSGAPATRSRCWSATARSRAVGSFGPMLGAWSDSRWRADEIDAALRRRGRALHRRRDRHRGRARALRRRAAAGRAGAACTTPTARWPRSTRRSTRSSAARRPTTRRSSH